MIFLFTASTGASGQGGAFFVGRFPFFRAGVIARYHFQTCVSLIDEIRDGKA